MATERTKLFFFPVFLFLCFIIIKERAMLSLITPPYKKEFPSCDVQCSLGCVWLNCTTRLNILNVSANSCVEFLQLTMKSFSNSVRNYRKCWPPFCAWKQGLGTSKFTTSLCSTKYNHKTSKKPKHQWWLTHWNSNSAKTHAQYVAIQRASN